MEMTGPNFATLGTNLPSVNLKETDKKKISSSWSKKEDFKIELDNKMLTISSEKNKKRGEKGYENYYRKRVTNHSPDLLIFRITRMKTKSMLIIKMAYCMLLLPKKRSGKKKTAKTIAINKEDLL
jgi:HSP20 family protein